MALHKMELHDLKYTEKERKKEEKKFEISPSENKYPYETRMRFDSEFLAKIPGLSKSNVGDVIIMKGEAEVVDKSVHTDMNKSNGKEKETSLTIQITKIGFENKANYSQAFKEAASKEKT